ncbi:MAG: DUF2726 domain-containing protein [Chloroflexi bacterium]|nr:DUF2726 domain-containing protein [Chloroflexota bacterium]
MDPLVITTISVSLLVAAACVVALAVPRLRSRAALPDTLGTLARARPGQPEFLPRLPYARAAYILPDEDRALFASLNAAAPDDLAVVPHVRLTDVLCVEPRTTQPDHYRDRIRDIVLDFVLCDRQTATPRLAALFEQPGAARGAAFVDAALVGAGIPVLRIARGAGTPAEALHTEIVAALGRPSRSATNQAAWPVAAPVTSPGRAARLPELVVVPRTPARYACGRCHREIRARARCCPHCGAVLAG